MSLLLDPQQVIAGTSVATFAINRDHLVTHWNKACEVLTGIPAAEVIGTNRQWVPFYKHPSPTLADLILDEANEAALQAHFKGAAKNSTLIANSYEVEAFRALPTGGKWLFFTVALVQDPDHQTVGAIETIQDITERKTAQENERTLRLELAQSVAELQHSLELLRTTQDQLIQTAKMAALGGLVAGVAHEINTPVGIGVTAASLLAEQTRECEALFQANTMKRSNLAAYFQIARESSEMILANLTRAAELIQRFKQVAVDQSNEEIRIISLRECLDNILLSLLPALKKQGHKVSVQCPEDIVMRSYAGALEQMVTLLVMNSVTHGFEQMMNGRIHLDVLERGDMIDILFRDNGKGIPHEHLGRIFEPFFTTKRNRGGTGLGLHILYNLVTQTLGGHVQCESSAGEGVKFKVTIPRTSPKNQSSFFKQEAQK